MTPILSAKNITKRYLTPDPINILQGIDLDLFPGESVAIVGKSGEGKSSLLHILGTLDSATSGSLTIHGKEVIPKDVSRIRQKTIGFIFQSYNLLEEYSVLDNVLFPGKIARADISEGSYLWKRAHDLLEQVGLSHRANFLAKKLSGGEKQRATLARALLNNPDILFADEPSGNLDSAHSSNIHQMLIDITKRLKKSLIVVTHDHTLAALCDRSYLLKDGKLHPRSDS